LQKYTVLEGFMGKMSQFFLMSSFALVGFVSAMDPVRKPSRMPLKEKRYLELENSQVWYYVGDDVNYYKEYRSKSMGNNLVTFPLECTDPLPIEYCGDTRFFVTSAKVGSTKAGSFYMHGQAYTILNPSITQVVVVRGIARSNNCPLQAYLGFNFKDFKSAGYKGCNKIHTARILALTTKKQQDGNSFGYSWGYQHSINLTDVKSFGNQEIGLEVKKIMLEHGIQEEDFKRSWNSPLFQAKVRELLGERAKDFSFTNQCIESSVSYWTEEENKLKRITYNSALLR
jgi:hypothetical protein